MQFSVHADKTLGLNCLLLQFLYSFQYTCINLTVNSCTKYKTSYVNHLTIPWAKIYILSCMDNQKALRQTIKTCFWNVMSSQLHGLLIPKSLLLHVFLKSICNYIILVFLSSEFEIWWKKLQKLKFLLRHLAINKLH